MVELKALDVTGVSIMHHITWINLSIHFHSLFLLVLDVNLFLMYPYHQCLRKGLCAERIHLFTTIAKQFQNKTSLKTPSFRIILP